VFSTYKHLSTKTLLIVCDCNATTTTGVAKFVEVYEQIEHGYARENGENRWVAE